jgi:hypothetical protein
LTDAGDKKNDPGGKREKILDKIFSKRKHQNERKIVTYQRGHDGLVGLFNELFLFGVREGYVAIDSFDFVLDSAESTTINTRCFSPFPTSPPSFLLLIPLLPLLPPVPRIEHVALDLPQSDHTSLFPHGCDPRKFGNHQSHLLPVWLAKKKKFTYLNEGRRVL